MSHCSAEPNFDPGKLAQDLRALPEFEPPAGGWMALQRRQRQQRRRRIANGMGGFAMAACLVLAVALPRVSPEPEPIIEQPAEYSELARLMQRSSELERQLPSARPNVRRWNGAQAVRVSQLQQGLSLIDYQINFAEPDEARRLWRERVELMDALVDLHQRPAPVLVQAAYQY